MRVPVANVWVAPNAGHLPLDPAVWPTAAVTVPERLALVGHMPTQLLYGERVRVLAVRSGWTEIAVPDQPSPLDRRGYPGWVRSWQLGPSFAAPLVVTARTAVLPNGDVVGFGSQVPRGAVPPADTASLPTTRADLVRTARMFLGLHYLWGGLSVWGYDCSGLAMAAWAAAGVTIPRDTYEQWSALQHVPLSNLQPGDLIYFNGESHVGIYVGGGDIIDAPTPGQNVEKVPPAGWYQSTEDGAVRP